MSETLRVDFYRHGLGPGDAAQIAEVLATPMLTSGAVGAAVEAQLCDYFSAPHALLTNSWTNGALAILLALGVGPGDEVIVPAMTFIATANVVELLGATTVLVDIDPETLLLTPEIAAAAVTPRTKAVQPVHLYGQMVDIAALRRALDAAAPGRSIAIIEDCAHCFEGTLHGKRPGVHSDAAIFSFYATKNVTCGEGGAIIFTNTALYTATTETRLHGMSAMAKDRFVAGQYRQWDMPRLGVKANLPDLLAALLPVQIRGIDEKLEVRENLAARYDAAFDGLPFKRPAPVASCRNAWHLYALGVPGGLRDAAIAALNAEGVSVTVNFRALPRLSYYAGQYPAALAQCPAAVAWGDQTLSLPFFPGMTAAEQDRVIAVVKDHVVPLVEGR